MFGGLLSQHNLFGGWQQVRQLDPWSDLYDTYCDFSIWHNYCGHTKLSHTANIPGLELKWKGRWIHEQFVNSAEFYELSEIRGDDSVKAITSKFFGM